MYNANKNLWIGKKPYGQIFVFLLFIFPYLSSFITSKIYILFNKGNIMFLCKQEKESHYFTMNKSSNIVSKNNSTNNFLDTCILNGLESILKIDGYIIFFSILSNIISKFLLINNYTLSIISPILEISCIKESLKGINIYNQLLIALPICTFGGFSAAFQSISMITNRNISKKNNIKYKVINSSISLAFAIIIASLIKYLN